MKLLLLLALTLTVDLAHDPVHARFYPPGTYYRGTRFDWSGVMPSLQWRGHTYCGQWFDHYDPTIHDAIMGPVESFAPYGHFIVIGVGRLAVSDSASYNPFHYYPIIDSGVWNTRSTKSAITFTQTLTNAYVYTKTIRLTRNGFRIGHTLTNTSQSAISTTVYDHNLFVLDSQRITTDLVIKLPWKITGTEQARRVKTTDSTITIGATLQGKEDAYAIISGGALYDIREQNKTAGIHITADRPLDKLVFWANARIGCPEPYIKLYIPPGKTDHWTITYTFYNP